MVTIAMKEKKNIAFRSNAVIGMLFFMATVTMLFAGAISALLIRRASSDWVAIYFPPLLLVNTAVILISSATLETARFSRNKHFWMAVTTVLGFFFLIGQAMAWRQLALHGVFLPTNPHASFFYILTGLHGLHLLGGLIFLSVATLRARQSKMDGNTLTLCRMYWHFLTVLWLYLLAVIL